MQQSLIQNRKSCKSFVARVGIALGIASVIAMAPMSNAMAETFYGDYYKAGDAAARTTQVNNLDKKMRTYCANRKKLVRLDNIITHFKPHDPTLVMQIRGFVCVNPKRN